MIRCERCNLAIEDGTGIGRVGLCPWCWEKDRVEFASCEAAKEDER